MAGGMDLGSAGKTGKKPLDTTINLVPFIDLMAVTIVFLIMTAVWTQLGGLQASQGGGQPGDVIDITEPVSLLLTATQLRLVVGDAALEPIPITRNDTGRIEVQALVDKLKELKARQPDRSAISLQADDAVTYDDLLRVIDTCIGAKFVGVSVIPMTTG